MQLTILAVYTSGFVEFYFETARTAMDLVVSQTLQNFTNLNFILAHVGGSFPSIIDRLEQILGIPAAVEVVYRTWYAWSILECEELRWLASPRLFFDK